MILFWLDRSELVSDRKELLRRRFGFECNDDAMLEAPPLGW